MTTEQERAEFEAFASKHGLCVTEDGDLYRSHVVAWMWKAWQARAALQSQDREALVRAVQEAISLLEPGAPLCCSGCEYEWNQALRVLREAIDHARRIEEKP